MDKEVRCGEHCYFSSDSCIHCQSAKAFLTENGFEFLDKNVNSNPEARKELVDKGYRGVPVIIIDGVEIVGFDKDKISNLLKI